ncbi:MAG TPA: chemotaxis protein CheB, partial [Geminicoccaceae bacterium]|nr:chemotaxis protein CheB [Geminicoccaceae bacterium]
MPAEQPPPQLEESASAPGANDSFPVLGVGASAGGIKSFQTFLDHMPPDGGMAFVLIQHLDPERKSMLAEIMAHRTGMAVRQAEDGMEVVPNAVYVIPPGAALTIEGGRLRLTPPTEPRGRRTPVDAFFLSLAEERGEAAIAVVLAGAGRDGTLGLRAIKDRGGLILAQAPDTADGQGAMSGMPRSAIETGLVDYVLPVEEMPARLLAYLRHRVRIDGPAEAAGGAPPEAGDHLTRICALLHDATGHDFSQYKDKTLIRRINRRMQVLQVDDADRYIERLRREPAEIDRLLQDLLIGVTHFFRDPEAFDALAEKVIPRIVAGKGADDQVRVWVPGCATGEEAYSIAILLREALGGGMGGRRVQVFATDIDEPALRVARAGQYPPSIAADVSPERLRRFFTSDGKSYRLAKEIRYACIFSTHNLIRDPPFSKLDLISCRNLLIYLNTDLQRRLIPLFHYALEAGGYLFLGSSENVSQHAGLFATVDKRHRIFQNRQKEARPVVDFPLAARGLRRTGAILVPPRRPALRGDDALEAARVVLDEFAPAYVVVDGRGGVVRFSARTGRYLTPPAGAPSTNLLDMARPGLRLDLRAALHRAIEAGETVARGDVRVAINGGVQTIRLTVRPLVSGTNEDGRYLVVFEDVGPIQTDGGAPGDRREGGGDDDVESATVRHLEDELRATRAHLESTIEELETANEELQSSNEDLLSANEELQSSNEELETSKEELESANEELHTVNAELN